MTMASPFLPWCRMRADDHQPVPNFAPFLSGSRTPVYPGHGLPPFGLQSQFPHSVLQSGPRPIYGFPRPDTQPTFGYPPSVPDQRQLYPYSRPMGGVIERDVTHSTEVSRVGTATGSPKTDLNPDPEDPDESGSVSSRHSDTRESESDDDTTQTNDIKSKYPDYCRTLTVTDASGQIKELVFPKALDLDRPKRARTTFSPDQLVTLEREFHKNQYLVGRERTDLAQRLGLSETQVKVWFQNRRTKFKRDKTREAEEEKIRAESSAACNILRIFQDRRVAPPSAPPPALPDPGTASPVGHQVSLGVGPSPQTLDKSASRGVTTDDGNRVTSCPFPVAGSRGLSHNVLFYT